MKLISTKFAGQTAEEIVAFLAKSGSGVTSAKIEQGIAIAILDGKRPANSGTLKKYVAAKCKTPSGEAVEITPHAFSVAVAYAALIGEGVGFTPEEKFIVVPLNWHLESSAIVNLVADPKAGLDDAGRAAVHEEVSEIYRTKPEKGAELLKLIKARFKPAPEKKGEGEGEKEPVAELTPAEKVAGFFESLAGMLQKDTLKAMGLAAADLTEVTPLQRSCAFAMEIDLDEAGKMLAAVIGAMQERIVELTAAPAAEVAAEPVAEPIAA